MTNNNITYDIWDDDDMWGPILILKLDGIRIRIEEPTSFEPKAIDNLINGKGSISGGGNSLWVLTYHNNRFNINYSISGCGGDSSIDVDLPYNTTIAFLKVLKAFSTFTYTSIEKFIENVEQMEIKIKKE